MINPLIMKYILINSHSFTDKKMLAIFKKKNYSYGIFTHNNYKYIILPVTYLTQYSSLNSSWCEVVEGRIEKLDFVFHVKLIFQNHLHDNFHFNNCCHI